jgi:hypothetical protein
MLLLFRNIGTERSLFLVPYSFLIRSLFVPYSFLIRSLFVPYKAMGAEMAA